ncbi:hypothetical protein ACFY0B_35815 [Streptomyces sp. NPDC001797]|uniref:hypothetical protein n=1 Tax=Streptomyces sp. NPDC001797 TaxID=3364610 RepID=UPI0036CB95C4
MRAAVALVVAFLTAAAFFTVVFFPVLLRLVRGLLQGGHRIEDLAGAQGKVDQLDAVFVFPAGEREETVALLDRHLPEQRNPWTPDGNLYIDIDDEQTGHLFSDGDPGEVAILEAAIGHHPTWAVQIDVSGRIDGTAEVHQMIALLLQHGGVATDDYAPHPWTVPEILSGAVIDGLCFFDFAATTNSTANAGVPDYDASVTAASSHRATSPESPMPCW